jgi:hypothetical protein
MDIVDDKRPLQFWKKHMLISPTLLETDKTTFVKSLKKCVWMGLRCLYYRFVVSFSSNPLP